MPQNDCPYIVNFNLVLIVQIFITTAISFIYIIFKLKIVYYLEINFNIFNYFNKKS